MRFIRDLGLVLLLFLLIVNFSEGLWSRRRRRRRRTPSGPNREACQATIDSYYRAILHRAPDGNGLNYWIGQCMQRMKVETIKHKFYHSTERRALCTRKITEFYRKLLGREPDTRGLNHWVNRCVGAKQSMSSIALEFQSSPEYKRAKCRRDVKTVYRDLLMKLPDQGGWNHYTNMCLQGTSLDTIRGNVYNSNERRTVCSREISKFYKLYLDRTPTQHELNQWVNLCSQGRRRLCRIMKDVEATSSGISQHSARSSQYVLYGCYGDKQHRAIAHKLASNIGNPSAIDLCAAKTKSLGYWTFGVQHNGQCFSASNAQHTFDRYGLTSNCRNGKGGAWSNDVYFFVPQYVYRGCFKDRHQRAMAHMVANFPGDRDAIAKCAFLTRIRGYRAFGVQYNGQCFTASNAHETYHKYGGSSACANTGRGGTWANAVYFLSHFMQIASFDTHGDGGAGVKFKRFVDGIPNDRIVLVAVQDEARHRYSNTVRDALKRLGARNPDLGYRGSYALVGYKGRRPSWVKEQKRGRGKGPTIITSNISKDGFMYSIEIRSEGCEDKHKHPGCGWAYLRINGKDYSHHRRGYNLLVIH